MVGVVRVFRGILYPARHLLSERLSQFIPTPYSSRLGSHNQSLSERKSGKTVSFPKPYYYLQRFAEVCLCFFCLMIHGATRLGSSQSRMGWNGVVVARLPGGCVWYWVLDGYVLW
jgi:hypothetical protein